MLGIYIGRDKILKDKNNFHDKIANMTKRFNIWSGRNLTILGRILISKTYGISNLIYSLTMSEADDNICKSAQTQINKFIWGYKPPKIKHTTLIGQIEKGGLKAIDVDIMQQSLMIAWTSRMWINNYWNSIINEDLNKYGGLRFLLRCNYDYSQLKIPNFYIKILRYSELVFKKEKSHNIIWNNKDIQIGGTQIIYKDWMAKGIIYIQDLCKENGDFREYDDFKRHYNLEQCFLKYVGVINCLKKVIRGKDIYKNVCYVDKPNINFNTPIFKLIDDSLIDIRKAKARIYYNILLEHKFDEPIALHKWTQELNITKEEVVKTFKLAKLSTKDSKLLTFNYKLINRLINNKANLFKWNIGTDPNCTFCDRNLIDDTYHSFMQCDWTYNKIKQILDDLDPLRTWAKLINHKTWIFGVHDPAINLIILIMKYYLSQTRNCVFDPKPKERNFPSYPCRKNTYQLNVSIKNNFNSLVDARDKFESENLS